jgi:hypothetical protein
MSRQLGFKCQKCGEAVFGTTEYFGENIRCDTCNQMNRIPLGFYCKIPLVYYRWASIIFALQLALFYLKFGSCVGYQYQGFPWLIPVWVLLITLVFCYHLPKSTAFFSYSAVFRKNPLEFRGHFSALGGDDIACYVPFITFLMFEFLYVQTSKLTGSDPIAFIRKPWLFVLIGALAAIFMTAIISAIAFQIAPERMKRMIREK